MRTGSVFDGRVIFDHLPKTAGQAVNAWLAGALGSGAVTPNLIGGHRELIKRFGGEFSIISGHLAFHGEGLDPRYRYMTCVREPIDRAVSWLSFVLQHEPESLGDLWIQADAFSRSEGTELGSVFKDSICNPYVNHFRCVLSLEQRDHIDDLTAALCVIEQYDVWGIYEDMAGFLKLAASMIELPAPKEIARVNVTRSRPSVAQVSAKLRGRLEELNALDLAFYSALQEHWRERAELRKEVTREPSVKFWQPYNLPEPRKFQSSDFELLSIELPGTETFSKGELVRLSAEFSLARSVPELEIGFHILDENGRWAFGINSTLLERKLINIQPGLHQVSFWFLTDLPDGQYRLGIGVAAKDNEKSEEMAWFDRLAEFRVENRARGSHGVGYSDLPVEFAFQNVSAVPVCPITDGQGVIELRGSLTDCLTGEILNCPISLTNLSHQAWGGTVAAPLYLSYQWSDANGMCVVADGLRSALPLRQLLSKQSVRADMSIKAPDLPGKYRLRLLPVQETCFWFDDRGFTPLELEVNVRSDVIPLALYGADVHFLSTSHGIRREAAMVSTGNPGCLLYGPYWPLSVGKYRVRIMGLATALTFDAYADVAYDRGRQILAKNQLSQEGNGVLAALEFDLSEAVQDFEVRVMVGANDVVSVNRVEIFAVDASADPTCGERE